MRIVQVSNRILLCSNQLKSTARIGIVQKICVRVRSPFWHINVKYMSILLTISSDDEWYWPRVVLIWVRGWFKSLNGVVRGGKRGLGIWYLISYCGWVVGGTCRRLTPRLACTDVKGVSNVTWDDYIGTVQANIWMPLYRWLIPSEYKCFAMAMRLILCGGSAKLSNLCHDRER